MALFRGATLAAACALIPGAALAQLSTTPGYTKFDQQEFAKLRAFVGTWRCTDVPASKKPDIETIKQVGNYFVVRESGDNPNTEYMRWSHGYRMFYIVEVDDQGGSSVAMTKSLDPLRTKWTTVYPTGMPDGKPFFPLRQDVSASTIRARYKYYDEKNRVRNGSYVCRKTS